MSGNHRSTTARYFPSVNVLGSRVHLVDTRQAVDRIENWIAEPGRGCRRVTVSGFHGLWMAHQDRKLRSILNSAELWVPDGIAPVWVARLRGLRATRATGTDLMQEFLCRANRRGYRSYFYGDTPDTLAALRERVERDFPGHVVAGAFSPPFRPLSPEEDEQVIAQINQAAPHVLWVGLGLPKQDRWIYEHLERLHVPVAIGVGAAFAFVAGTVRKCPQQLGKLGLEWAYRLLKEPKKLWRRDFLDAPQFLFHLGLELTGIRKYE